MLLCSVLCIELVLGSLQYTPTTNDHNHHLFERFLLFQIFYQLSFFDDLEGCYPCLHLFTKYLLSSDSIVRYWTKVCKFLNEKVFVEDNYL